MATGKVNTLGVAYEGKELPWTDLNDATVYGHYYVTSNSTAAAISNRPSGISGGFGLDVIRAGATSRIMQIYYPNEVDAIFIRHIGQVVTSWTRIPSSS